MRNVANEAGIPQPELDRVVELWEQWDEAIRKGEIKLTPWGSAASAEPFLSGFLQKYELKGRMPTFGLTEVGTEVFRRALLMLRNNGGRRDAPVKFLLDEIEEAEGSDREEICEVYRLFQHYTFAAIAKSNDAAPEFTVRVGDQDSALSSNDLDRIEASEDNRHPVNMHPSIVSGLGGIDGMDYVKIKAEVKSRIRTGIEEFHKSDGTDSSKLHSALDFLADEIGEKVPDAEGGVFRSMTAVGAGAALGFVGTLTLDIVLNPDGSDQWRRMWIGTGGAIVGGILGAAGERTVNRLATNHDHRLLRKSLVRAVENERSVSVATEPKRWHK